jgi:drug/metabolite transporter (DMT)-like permease
VTAARSLPDATARDAPPNAQTLRALPYLRLLGAQLAIGAAAIFARFALAGAGPFAVSALRLGIATFAVLVLARRVRPLPWRHELGFALAGLALAIHFGSWIASLDYTTVAISTLLVTTTPIWTEAFEVVRSRRLPARTYVVALACGIGGVAAIVSATTSQAAPIPGHALLGEGLALIGSLAIGAYLIIVRDAGNALVERLPTRAIVLRTYGWAALALTVGAVATGQSPPAAADTRAWGGILAMALVSQLLGHTALNAALRDFTPSIVALTTLLEAPIAAGLAALIFHETLSLQAAVGGALILGAVAAVLRRSANAPLDSSAGRRSQAATP